MREGKKAYYKAYFSFSRFTTLIIRRRYLDPFFPKLYLSPPVSFARFIVENAFKVFNESEKIYLLELEEILQLEKEGDV